MEEWKTGKNHCVACVNSRELGELLFISTVEEFYKMPINTLSWKKAMLKARLIWDSKGTKLEWPKVIWSSFFFCFLHILHCYMLMMFCTVTCWWCFALLHVDDVDNHKKAKQHLGKNLKSRFEFWEKQKNVSNLPRGDFVDCFTSLVFHSICLFHEIPI